MIFNSEEINKISESQVEEALVTNLNYLRELLNLQQEIKLIARQMNLRAREKRIDILIAHGKDMGLVELKITKYENANLDQIVEYRNELIKLQENNELVKANIISYLLVVEANSRNIEECKKQEVNLIVYRPVNVLSKYYENLSASAAFLNIKPNDYGVFNIGLINRTLKELVSGHNSVEAIAQNTKLSESSVKNHLRLGRELGLIRQRKHLFYLTDIGDKYSDNFNEEIFLDKLTNVQKELLKEFVSKDPFFSSTVFGIYSIVESCFILSRNTYPILLKELRHLFQIHSGKSNEWRAERTVNTATYTFLNFAIDLDLLGKLGNQIVITPAGFRFILMLQLYKSIEMIDYMNK
ncbi:MAG TPA: helix-turn-helix domain-containing protein [Chitinophagales bacterium]|nr:helix-turn-helix domain-containing protein [Chitinophagales bacterium]HNG09640.1 helix-turn-helix domain-containing protein [Chitinophagales bacterium]HNK90919.1 helix-turn-helix domain-containing protein [Chitinophagales bacterium]